MSGKVYFGNANKQTWIKAPQTGLRAGTGAWVSEQQLLNGRTHVKRSPGSHRRFEASWMGSMNSSSLDTSLQTIKDFADGVYGDGPFFWNDPYAVESNLFASHVAAPALSIATGMPSLFPKTAPIVSSSETTASLSASVGSNSKNYPINTAVYTASGTELFESNVSTFYIPAGYTLWLGFHGSASASGGAYYQASLAGVAGTATKLTALSVDTSTIVNTSIESTAADKVDFYFAKTTTSACEFNVSGLVAQLLPTGSTPSTGNFISGRGTTGLQFSSPVQMEYYSSKINNGQIGLSVTMVEV